MTETPYRPPLYACHHHATCLQSQLCTRLPVPPCVNSRTWIEDAWCMEGGDCVSSMMDTWRRAPSVSLLLNPSPSRQYALYLRSLQIYLWFLQRSIKCHWWWVLVKPLEAQRAVVVIWGATFGCLPIKIRRRFKGTLPNVALSGGDLGSRDPPASKIWFLSHRLFSSSLNNRGFKLLAGARAMRNRSFGDFCPIGSHGSFRSDQRSCQGQALFLISPNLSDFTSTGQSFFSTALKLPTASSLQPRPQSQLPLLLYFFTLPLPALLPTQVSLMQSAYKCASCRSLASSVQISSVFHSRMQRSTE